MAEQYRNDLDNLSDAQRHVTAARGVLESGRDSRRHLSVDSCGAVSLLLQRAFDLIVDTSEPLTSRDEFLHAIFGAMELANFGSDNDRGVDDLFSGLSPSAAILAIRALEAVDLAIEQAKDKLAPVNMREAA
jgi:hypothetical protein